MAETHLTQLHVEGAAAIDGALTAASQAVTGAVSGGGGTISAAGALTLKGGTINAAGTLSVAGTLHTFGTQQIGWGAAAPGSGTWYIGNIVFNTAPAASGAVGWVCTAQGAPGTWKAFGTLAA